MALNQWPKFAFFDKKLLKRENGETTDILQSSKIFASTSGRGKLIFGDAEGMIIILDQKFSRFAFRAFMCRVTHLSMTKQQNILVSVGDDEEGSGPTMKIWNFDKIDAAGIPACSRIIQLSSKAPDPVTCFAVHENLNYLAIGFSSGAVALYKGDITKERNSAKPTIIHDAKSPITGLAFRPTTSGKGGVVLYISSLDEIWSFTLGAKDKENKIVLDHLGCEMNCSTMTDSAADYQLVIGKPDAFYFYLPDSRGQCLAFGGEKVLLEWSHGYLVVVSRKEESKGSLSSSTEMQIITIYDVRNKLIAYYGPIPEVKGLLSEWGSLFVLCDDNRMFQIREKELPQKLDTLFQKHMYSLAISLARAQQYDKDSIADMFKRYGDHLYAKGDVDEAMNQYIRTIPRLEPSYVIRQYLDAQRIHNLTNYLKALHENNVATEDHTTLLLNCYTKLKDKEQLDKFVRNPSVNFDVETAIRVLRQSGYFPHALYLSKLHKKHDWYLKIQLEDIENGCEEALDYISKLDFASCESSLKTYGKVLMTNAPKETTRLLQKLCTNLKSDASNPKSDASNLKSDASNQFSPTPFAEFADPEEFFHIFVTHPREMRQFLEYIIENQEDCSSKLHYSLLELYLEAIKRTTDNSEKTTLEEKAMKLLKQSAPDSTASLIICQSNNFSAGILFLFEQKGMFADILQYSIDQKNFEQAMDTCRRFGDKDSHLWVQTFWFLARNFGEFDKKLLQEALQVIEQKSLIPPLLVVDILAKNPNATLDVVRDYIIRRMQCDVSRIKEDELQVKSYFEKTDKIRTQVEEIKTKDIYFQDANCTACEKSLELPSVHFLCKHSYHQHCFEAESYSDAEECPVCKPANRKLLDEIRAQDQNSDFAPQFFDRVNRDTDSFSVVADFFGKGLFGTQVSIDDLIKPATGL